MSPAQERAIEALLAGKTVTAAAKSAGVDRTTVHRWQQQERFSEEFETRRLELQSVIRERLFGMAHKAATALETSLDSGDARSALALLRGLRLLDDDSAVTVNVNESLTQRACPREPLTIKDAESEFRAMLDRMGIPVPAGFQYCQPDIPIEVCDEE